MLVSYQGSAHPLRSFLENFGDADVLNLSGEAIQLSFFLCSLDDEDTLLSSLGFFSFFLECGSVWQEGEHLCCIK